MKYLMLQLNPGLWVKGESGQPCDEVCQTIGKVCNAEKQSGIDSESKVKDAFKQAGYTCKSILGKEEKNAGF